MEEAGGRGGVAAGTTRLLSPPRIMDSGRKRQMGRGEVLQQRLAGVQQGKVYKPVSSTGSEYNGVPAIPGQCLVVNAWSILSNAPVAYQVQKMVEDQCIEDQFIDDMLMSSSNSQQDKSEEYVNMNSMCDMKKKEVERISELPFRGNSKGCKESAVLKKSNHEESLSGWSKNSADMENSCRLHDVRRGNRSSSLAGLSGVNAEKSLRMFSKRDASIWEPLADLHVCTGYSPELNSEEFPVLSPWRHDKI